MQQEMASDGTNYDSDEKKEPPVFSAEDSDEKKEPPVFSAEDSDEKKEPPVFSAVVLSPDPEEQDLKSEQETLVVVSSYPPITDCYTFSLFVSVFCCFPLGLVALFQAIQARRLIMLHNYREASKRIRLATGFAVAALVCGLAAMTFIVVFFNIRKHHSTPEVNE